MNIAISPAVIPFIEALAVCASKKEQRPILLSLCFTIDPTTKTAQIVSTDSAILGMTTIPLESVEVDKDDPLTLNIEAEPFVKALKALAPKKNMSYCISISLSGIGNAIRVSTPMGDSKVVPLIAGDYPSITNLVKKEDEGYTFTIGIEMLEHLYKIAKSSNTGIVLHLPYVQKSNGIPSPHTNKLQHIRPLFFESAKWNDIAHIEGLLTPCRMF